MTSQSIAHHSTNNKRSRPGARIAVKNSPSPEPTESFLKSEAPPQGNYDTRAAKLAFAGQLLGPEEAAPVVNLYDSLSAAQEDGQLRGAEEPATFPEFTQSVAAQPEELSSREAAFEGALIAYPGSDHQNVYRFVEAEY